MARQFGRQRPEVTSNVPPGYEMLAGENGPYLKTDNAEFYHAGKEAQQWFLRLDEADIQAVVYTVKLGCLVRSVVKWGRRGFWCFTAGLGAALTIGENLQKLPGMISNVGSLLKGLFGI